MLFVFVRSNGRWGAPSHRDRAEDAARNPGIGAQLRTACHGRQLRTRWGVRGRLSLRLPSERPWRRPVDSAARVLCDQACHASPVHPAAAVLRLASPDEADALAAPGFRVSIPALRKDQCLRVSLRHSCGCTLPFDPSDKHFRDSLLRRMVSADDSKQVVNAAFSFFHARPRICSRKKRRRS